MMGGADTLSMSIYDYTAAIHCWSKAHRTETEPEQISDDDARELMAEAAGIDWSKLEERPN